MQSAPKNFLFLLMLFAMFFWGASWASGKAISGVASPEVLIFWRLGITFLSFIVLLLVTKRNTFLLPLKHLPKVLVLSLFFVIYNELFFRGLETGLAGKGGVIVTTLNPLFTFALTALFFRQRISALQITGLGIGIVGGFILLELWVTDVGVLLASGNLYFIFGALSWAVVTVLTQQALRDIGFLTFCFYVYGINTFLSFLLALPHSPLAVLTQDHVFWINMVFISVVAISFSTSVYFYASRKLGANRTSSFTFIVPAAAVGTCWLFLGETPKIPTIIGGTLALSATGIINWSAHR